MALASPCVRSTSGICDGVDECRRAVRRQVSYGADAIKFVATGGVLSNIKAGLDQQFTDDEIRSIIETAHRLGRRVAAHAHGAAGAPSTLKQTYSGRSIRWAAPGFSTVLKPDQ